MTRVKAAAAKGLCLAICELLLEVSTVRTIMHEMLGMKRESKIRRGGLRVKPS